MTQFIDKDFGNCKILFKKGTKLENVYLFASHTSFTSIPDYVYYYLEEINKTGYATIFISSSPVSRKDLSKLELLVDWVIEKENKGTDFGAWSAVLRQLNYGRDFKTLFLCNDSVFGPFCPLQNIHNKFESASAAIIGITDSFQGKGYHIQSYFIGFKRTILGSTIWQKFWEEMEFHKDKQKVIEFYEIGLTQQLIKAGHTLIIWTEWSKKIDYKYVLKKISKNKTLRQYWLSRVLYEKQDFIYDINPCSFLWEELITICNNPFLKREMFIFSNLVLEFDIEAKWEAIISSTKNYPPGLIKSFLIQQFLFKNFITQLENVKGLTLSIINFAEKEINAQVTDGSFFLRTIRNSLNFVSPGTTTHIYTKELEILDTNGIQNLSLLVKAEVPLINFDCTLIYIDYNIITRDSSFLNQLKTILKRLPVPIIIVPDEGLCLIISSVFSLNSNVIFNENELFFQSGENQPFRQLASQFDLSSKRKIPLFQRPSLAELVKDVMNNENNTNFISNERLFNESFIPRNFNENEDNYISYASVHKKYKLLYEDTPLWYKKFGHFLKVVTGNKHLEIKWKDKDEKTLYQTNTPDLIHWYKLQYEVLPEWYKKIGRFIIKSRKK